MRGTIDKRVGKNGTSHRVRVELPPDPITGKRLALTAPLPKELSDALGRAGVAWQAPSTV